MKKNFSLILASGSPRRQQLLKELGYTFEIRLKEVDETVTESVPAEKTAEYLSIKKAAAYQESLTENEVLITADTTVVLNQLILNKPQDRKEAISMLSALSGKKHQVISGVCITSSSKQVSFSVSTHVYFKELSLNEIEYYIDTYQPFDKAGAYGIQEWIGHAGIQRIEGSYFNVVGLPTFELLQALEQF